MRKIEGAIDEAIGTGFLHAAHIIIHIVGHGEGAAIFRINTNHSIRDVFNVLIFQ